MAQVDIVVEQPLNYDSTWSHVFQGANTVWLGFPPTRYINGNFFNGLQGQIQSAFDTQIPPGATIISATYEYTPYNNNFNPTFDTTISTPNRALATQGQDPLQTPFQIYRNYRRDQWSNAQVGALSTTFTAVFGTSVTTNASWIMRQITAPGGTIPNRDHMAQKITTRTGNMTIASLFWDLSRTGNPSGDLTVRIQGVTIDRGVPVPDGVDIAVSNPVSCASVPGVQTLTIFTFPVAPTLVPLTDYFILIEATYPANNADYISVHHQNAFIIAGGGFLFHYGDGLGMDWQNHPGTVDLNQNHQTNQLLAEDVNWPIDAQVVGVAEVSPDISSLVQAQVDAANYTLDSGIIITLSRNAPTNQSRWMASNTDVTWPGPILRVSYLEPEPPDEGVFPTGVRPGPDRRILRDDDDTAVVLAHAFMEMRKRWR